MFLGFLWLVIHFWEWMFGVLYRLSYYFYRFGHSLSFLVEVERLDNCREGSSLRNPPCIGIGSGRFKQLEYTTDASKKPLKILKNVTIETTAASGVGKAETNGRPLKSG
jgi:hypothetical protein